jgi:hypothetical protein
MSDPKMGPAPFGPADKELTELARGIWTGAMSGVSA